MSLSVPVVEHVDFRNQLKGLNRHNSGSSVFKDYVDMMRLNRSMHRFCTNYEKNI